MATEIERKFLIANDEWQLHIARKADMRQGYLAGSEQASIRVRIAGDRAYLNIKSATLGVTRKEYEYGIPMDDAKELLNTLCNGPIIEKTRFYVQEGRHTWEIDVFRGDNVGLVVAEIELKTEDEEFEKPNWAGEEVSHDTRYYNSCLVKHPYKDWEK